MAGIIKGMESNLARSRSGKKGRRSDDSFGSAWIRHESLDCSYASFIYKAIVS
jgi:hypothetical protein